jgi:hypothetical protein
LDTCNSRSGQSRGKVFSLVAFGLFGWMDGPLTFFLVEVNFLFFLDRDSFLVAGS